MALLSLCLIAVLLFAVQSLQDSKDPLNDFCRRWGHQTAQVGGKLYVDGGLIVWNPISSNSPNYTNEWLLYSDLNTSVQDMPRQYANLSKDSNVPSVSGGTLWADEVNQCFYLYGGEYDHNPADFSFWAYDIALNQWNETKYTSNVDDIYRVAYGAGTQVDELGVGYYYGGWQNNRTTPGWSGGPLATSNLIRYDYTEGTLQNNTGPDNVGRAEGSMLYLPASDGGLLIYFGGVEDPDKNGSFVGANMSTIHIFDINSSKWYKQTASGSVPASRRQFCAGVTWADDHSSYNIYLYGGFGVDSESVTAFDDSYILSIPSFNWIRAWPTDNATTNSGHGGCSANVVGRDQMLIIGGWFPDKNDCDSPNALGQHNMNLGFNGPNNALWDKYEPGLTKYFIPTPVISVIGGGPTGGARATKPSTWDNPDLSVYFTRVPTFSARTATRSLPTSTGDSSGDGGSKTNVGAIAGGVVGGLVGLIAILLLVLFCLRRRKNALKNREEPKTPSPPPAELAATSPVHEMHSPGTAKYVSMHSTDPNTYSTQSGPQSMHSGSPDNHHSQPAPYSPNIYQPIPTAAPQGHQPYHSPDLSNQYNHQEPLPYPSYYDTNNAYEQNQPSPLEPPGHPHQPTYSYPNPSSPSHPPMPPPPQNQPQVYYPPPPDPSTRSHPSFSDRMSSPGSTNHLSPGTEQFPPSTTQTPAHFYAQPQPQNGMTSAGIGHEYQDGVDGDVGTRGGSVGGGSIRRPIRGRFVEVGNM